MFIRTAVAVLAAATIIKAGTAFAQTVPAPIPPNAPPAAGAPGEHRHHGFQSLFRDLNLTADQQAKIAAIRQKYRQQNENVTDPQQRHANMKARRDEIIAVLTPQQRTKLEQKMQQMRERWRNREAVPPGGNSTR